MRQALVFAAVAAAVVLVGGWLATLAFRGPGVAQAVWTSAAIAWSVQIIAFGVARGLLERNPIAGWGLGSLLRFGVLIVYALVGATALGLALGPALVSLAGFLFVTMLLEPIFLRK
ncbi:MAG: hypothetical protein WD771_08740 [Gemmatimonadaceae bacterium]